MATISVGGIGSGLDVNGILEQIVDAERTPTEKRLNSEETLLQAELSSFGTIKSAVSSFQSSLSKISTESQFKGNEISSSESSVLTATSSSIAPEGNYSVEVRQLAQSHTLASISFAEMDQQVGTGTLTFSFGSTVYDPGTDFATGDDTYSSFTRNTELSDQSIVIDSSNNTVAGIRDAINQANIGVTASIVDDGNGYRLLISSTESGENNGLQINVDEGGAVAGNVDNSGLSVLAFNAAATNMEQTQQAQDAEITVNGLVVKRASNLLSGAIPGVTLNLKKVSTGPVQLNITSTSKDETKANIRSFVEAYNELSSLLADLTKYGGQEEDHGLLLGDTTVRNMIQQMRRELGNYIDNGGSYNSLSSIGITTQRDGSLSINDETLSKALDDDFEAVASLFYENARATDSQVSYLASSTGTQVGNYGVSISALAQPASLQGEPVSGPIILDATNNRFSLTVDGITTGTIALSSGTYNDLADLAQEIENRVNADVNLQRNDLGVTVSYENGAFVLASSKLGSESSIKLGTQNSTLGLTASAVITNGQDVSGTIGGNPATGKGSVLTGTGSASGLELTITGTQTGSRGSVAFSRGIAAQLDALLTDFLASDGQLTAKTDSIQSQIEGINTERAELNKRVNNLEERYRKQFISLDVLLGQLKVTSDYLTQQLDAIPQIGKQK